MGLFGRAFTAEVLKSRRKGLTVAHKHAKTRNHVGGVSFAKVYLQGVGSRLNPPGCSCARFPGAAECGVKVLRFQVTGKFGHKCKPAVGRSYCLSEPAA